MNIFLDMVVLLFSEFFYSLPISQKVLLHIFTDCLDVPLTSAYKLPGFVYILAFDPVCSLL